MRCRHWKNAFAKRKRRHNAEFAENNRELRKSRGGQDARWQPRDFCLYLRPSSESRTDETLTGKPHGARRGLNANADSLSGVNKMRGSAEYVERRSRIGICEGMDMYL